VSGNARLTGEVATGGSDWLRDGLAKSAEDAALAAFGSWSEGRIQAFPCLPPKTKGELHIKINVEQEHFRTSDETRNGRLFRTIDADPEVSSKPQTETLIGLSVAPKYSVDGRPKFRDSCE
jgi:hypothetical protein